jgi:type IV pilus assembly protein PilE
MTRCRRSGAGFTLIEIMIVIVIISLVAAFGYPAYQDYTRKSRRAAAHAALADLAARQEQFFLDNKSYTTSPVSLGLSSPLMTNGGYYSIIVTTVSATGYEVWATPQGSQAKDTGCDPLKLDSGGERTPADCW